MRLENNNNESVDGEERVNAMTKKLVSDKIDELYNMNFPTESLLSKVVDICLGQHPRTSVV